MKEEAAKKVIGIETGNANKVREGMKKEVVKRVIGMGIS
jgi:hypothetical protein